MNYIQTLVFQLLNLLLIAKKFSIVLGKLLLMSALVVDFCFMNNTEAAQFCIK